MLASHVFCHIEVSVILKQLVPLYCMLQLRKLKFMGFSEATALIDDQQHLGFGRWHSRANALTLLPTPSVCSLQLLERT